MKYHAVLEAYTEPDTPETLYCCFAPEEKCIKKGRAKSSVRKTKKKLIFDIAAEDSTGLRTVMNSITKLLTVYEKTCMLHEAHHDHRHIDSAKD